MLIPRRKYPVRQSTAHPVNEQARVDRFATLLGALALEPRVALELGELMYASHASYSAMRTRQRRRPIDSSRWFALKVTSAVCSARRSPVAAAAEPWRSSAPSTPNRVVREISAAYAAEAGVASDVFVDSGPGAEETGVLLIEHGARDGA